MNMTPLPLISKSSSNEDDYTYLFSNIKTPEQMGISSNPDPNILNNFDNNISILNEYNNAMTKGSSSVFVNNPNKQPLGNRYFQKTNSTCSYNPPSKDNSSSTTTNTIQNVTRNILIDNMKYLKDGKGNIDTTNTGLLYSAAGSLQDVVFVNNNDFEELSNSNTCVEVTIETDANGTTDTGYISIGDYKKADCTAFPKKCKKYTGKNKCEPCNEVNVHIGSISSASAFFIGNKVEVNYHKLGSWFPATITNVNNDRSYDIQYDTGLTDTKVGIELMRSPNTSSSMEAFTHFDIENTQKYNNIQSPSSSYIDNNFGNHENTILELYPSKITHFYFSAISMIGIYIIYQLLYKNRR